MQIADKSHDTKGMVTLAAICAVLQLALSPNLAIGNGHPNFALIFCACIALSRGGAQGVVGGFAAGLFFDLSSTGPIGLMALLLTIAAYALGSIAMLMVGSANSIIDAVIFRAVPTTFLSIVAFIPFAYFFSRVKASSLSGGHFSRRGI